MQSGNCHVINYCLELRVSVLSSHETVFSTQHQYTQCPCCLFIQERYKFFGHRQTEQNQNNPNFIKVKHVKG